MTVRPIRILVVEDDAVDRMAIERALKDYPVPHELASAACVAEALAALEKGGIDLALLDQRLPDGPGLDVLRQADDVPCIFITAVEEPALAVEAMKAGAYNFLQKDANRSYLELLPSAIDAVLERRRMEQELRESEEQYRIMFDRSPDAVALINVPDGEIVEFNDQTLSLLGYTHEELLGMTLAEIEAGESPEEVRKHCEEIVRAGFARFETQHRRKDGEIRDVLITAGSVTLRGKTYIQGILRDLTREKEQARQLHRHREHLEELVAERTAALRDSEHRYRAMVEDMPMLVCRYRPDGEIIHVNAAYERFFGKKPGELTGQSFFPLIPEADRDGVKEMHRQLTPEAPTRSHEHRVLLPDGTIGWQRWTNRAIFDDAGRLTGYQSVGEDITESKQAKIAATRFGNILEDSLNEIYVFDAETLRFIMVNRGARENLGYTSEELKRLTPLDLKPEFTSEKLAELIRPLREGTREAVQFTTVHRRKDGSLYPVEVLLQLMHEDPPVFVAMILDISERRRHEEERIALERQVQHAQKMESLGILAGGIAHDFNNILMAILGNADIALQDISHHAPARDNILEIENAAKRAAGLSRQMLAYSGKGKFVLEAIDVNELVEEMGHMLEVAISKKVVLRYNFADNLPPFEGDATQVRQIIMNLITNASEAAEEKSGVVAISTGAMHCDRTYLDSTNATARMSLEDPLNEGMYVYFEVADTGCGMSAETQRKMFDPFFTTKFTGRGLGMAAVLGIVRGHRGTIKVYSEEGKGSAFKVLFPTTEAMDQVRTEGARVQTQAWSGDGTILIADDEESVCAVGKAMLERIGFRVLTATDGREALRVFGENRDAIDCVLLDLTMPHLDGEQVFREIRRIRPETRVILSSGYNEQDATQRFSGKGLAGFIQKPYSSRQLTEAVREVFEAR